MFYLLDWGCLLTLRNVLRHLAPFYCDRGHSSIAKCPFWGLFVKCGYFRKSLIEKKYLELSWVNGYFVAIFQSFSIKNIDGYFKPFLITAFSKNLTDVFWYGLLKFFITFRYVVTKTDLFSIILQLNFCSN